MKKFRPGVADFGEAEEVPARPSSMIPAEEHRDRRREIVSGAVIKDLRTADEFANEIGSLWSQAQERFIDIGRYLLAAKKRLVEHGGFMELVRTRLPFSQAVANKLMAVARALDEGEFPLGRCPAPTPTLTRLSRWDQTNGSAPLKRGSSGLMFNAPKFWRLRSDSARMNTPRLPKSRHPCGAG